MQTRDTCFTLVPSSAEMARFSCKPVKFINVWPEISCYSAHEELANSLLDTEVHCLKLVLECITKSAAAIYQCPLQLEASDHGRLSISTEISCYLGFLEKGLCPSSHRLRGLKLCLIPTRFSHTRATMEPGPAQSRISDTGNYRFRGHGAGGPLCNHIVPRIV